MTEDRIITLRLPGKAWLAQSFGNDPHWTADESCEDIGQIVKLAHQRPRGSGVEVVVHGPATGMEHLAKWFEDDGKVWASEPDPATRADGRACLEAARRIRVALVASQE